MLQSYHIQQVNMQVHQEMVQPPQASQPVENLGMNDSVAGKLHGQLTEIFKTFMDDIAKHTKIHSYLQEINITHEDILTSYQKIVLSNQELVKKSATSQIIGQGTIKYFQFLLAFIKGKSTTGLDSKGRTVWYIQVETKLRCCLQFFHSFKLQKDITNSPVEDYPAVWARIHILQAIDVEKIKKDYKDMKKILHVATSATINESQHDFSLIKKIRFGLSFPKYMIMNDSAKLRSFLFYRTPTLEMAQKIWNLHEQGATKEFSKIIFEGIKTNLKMYIPADGKIDNKVDIFQERPDAITVRILYNKKVKKFPELGQSGCCESQKETQYIDKVVVHMHGGGFVALSSRSMQNYTRKWANQLGVPIISIDYRMPPDHPFPQAPYDCLTVYKFILEHLHRYVNIKPSEIYLTGDSAGGNLACVLTGLILKEQLLIPKGLYISYPATDMRFVFSTSRLYAITDPLLWPSMLLICLNSYLKGDITKANDPLASPLLLTEEYIGGAQRDKRFPLKWPKTVITVGNRDPLYDDSLMLMQKMVEVGVDCECIVYDQMAHGYLSTELFIKESSKALKLSSEHLKKLIGLP